MVMSSRRLVLSVVALVALFVLTLPVSAQVVKKRLHSFDDVAFQKAELRLTTQVAPLEESQTLAAANLQQDFDVLLTKEDVRWQMNFDRMTGLPNTLGGQGLPWIPGDGLRNELRARDLGLPEEGQVPLAFVAKRALDFVRAYPALFGAKVDELSLNTEGSGPMLDYLYYMQFHWIYQGVPVENAGILFTLNHGNLIEVGQTNISPAIRTLDTRPALDVETAWQIVHGFLGEAGPEPTDDPVEPGRLLIVPVTTGRALEGLPSEPGQGLAYRLVWVVAFHREGVMGTWEARVDAHTGEILAFKDSNAYGSIRGGVYKTDKPFSEQNIPLPRADYGSGFADDAGNFPGTGTASTLSGEYVDIVDSCGSISQASASGLIDFGASAGLDCTTPGHGGAGNTHAARTQYWNVTKIKQKALTYLAVAWLGNQLTDNVNLNQTCNAYWNGTSLNFFRSGGGCWNTGELPGVSLHEFGHGLDRYDGNNSSPDKGTGETYGDITSVLQTHSSCTGNGFMGTNCTGYGDSCNSCTGVRDIDWGKHKAGAAHVPSQLDDSSGFHCSLDASYFGPCGYEGHCESYISSEAVWDLAARDLPAMGVDANSAWQIVDRLWYASRPSALGAYSCSKSGTAPNQTFTTSGCGAGSLWRVFRAADDDDGDTTNGTPHSAALYAAFNRHVIACTTDAGSSTNSGCATAVGPVALTATPGNAQVRLDWSAATNAQRYILYRNEAGCDAGYTKIAEVAAPTVTYTDTQVVNGITYYYRVQGHRNASLACGGPVSDCGTARLTGCTPPGAPAGLLATANGAYRIDLSWSSVGGAIEYSLYRGTTAGGPYTYLATVSSALTAYSDTAVYGGTTYYYVVRTFAHCESANSSQASALAGGTCNRRPTFAGLTSAANGLNATCRVDLAWSAATSICGGTLTYTVYRSRTATFTPGPGYVIASGLTGTTYQDPGTSLKQVYYYLVRARDSVSGLEDENLEVRSAYPTGARVTIYSNTFEANATNWAFTGTLTPLATGPLTGTWLRGIPTATTNNYGGPGQPGSGHASSYCLFTAQNTSAAVDDVDYGTAFATSPTFNASAAVSAQLDIWRWFLNDHTATVDGCSYPDGYRLEVSSDGGTNWTALETLDESCSTQNGCGTNTWTNVKFLLEDYTTLTSNMKFRISATDGQNTPNGSGVCEGDLVEAALDDVYIYGYSTCTACTAPPAPGSLLATPGSNAVTLVWGASTGAAGYTIYRSTGACPGAAYLQVATGVSGTTWTDTAVSAGIPYSYVVRATSATFCESAASSCAQATPTGLCTQAPSFSGLASAGNAHGATCGVTLSWSAATGYCGGAVTYAVYRSTSPTFTPGPTSLLAKGVSATTYSDTIGLTYGTTYYYAVRAEDAGTAGSGPSGGLQDSNLVIRSAGASGPAVTGGTIFSDNFESGTGLIGWTSGNFTGATSEPDVRGNMACASPAPPSGNNVFRWGGATCTGTYSNQVASFGSPLPSVYGIDIPWDATNVTMTFKHRYRFQQTYDGGTLLLQKAPTRTYYFVSATALSGHVYNYTTAASGNPLGANIPCWGGTQDVFQTTTVNLDAMCTNIDGLPCAGSSLAIAFTGSSNTTTPDYGWFIDDVVVTGNFGATSCATAGCAMQVTLTRSVASVAAGADIVFQASHTTGVGPYNYQWTEDGSDIVGATSATLAVNKASAQTHSYNCKVTDAGATVCTDVLASPALSGTWTSAGGNPPAVPNGSDVPGEPLKLVRNTTAPANVDVTWAANCTNDTDYRLLWGDVTSLSLVSNETNGTVTSATCSLGTTGAATNVTSPSPTAGQCFFCVIDAVNGSQFGRHGNNSAGNERVLSGDTTFCGATTKNTTATTCN